MRLLWRSRILWKCLSFDKLREVLREGEELGIGGGGSGNGGMVSG